MSNKNQATLSNEELIILILLLFFLLPVGVIYGLYLLFRD